MGRKSKSTGRYTIIKSLKLNILGLLLCALAGVVSPVSAHIGIIVEHYSIEEGLRSNTVYTAIKDKDGFVWFGTWHGLWMFDGLKMTPYISRHGRNSDIPPKKITNIVMDGDGNMWIRNADNHLFLYDRHADTFHDMLPELQQHSQQVQVVKVQNIDNGRVLVHTRNRNLYEAWLDKSGPHIKLIYDATFDLDKSSLKLKRNIMGENHQYVYYIGCDLKILAFQKKGNYRQKLHDAIYQDIIQKYELPQVYLQGDSLIEEAKVCDTKKHGIFVLHKNGQLLCYNSQTKLPEALPMNVANSRFFDMKLDDDGQLWLASTNQGVFKISFPHYNFQFMYPQQLSLSSEGDDGVRGLYQQKNGNLWVSTRSGKLYCFDINSNQLLKEYQDVGKVYHFMEDHKGRLWVSTKGNGLVRINGEEIIWYKHSDTDIKTLSSNRVYYSYEDSKHRIWVCTFSGGLNLLQEKGEEVRFLHNKNELKNYPGYGLYLNVRSIAEDKEGRLWVATQDGLMSIDGNFASAKNMRFEIYRKNNVLTSDIYTMYCDKYKNIWLGIFGAGLNKIVAYDRNLHAPKLKEYSFKEGTIDDVITSVIEDKQGYLWLCTENTLASMKQGSDYIRSYDSYSGFPKVVIEDNTAICLKDGRVAIGCKQGIVVFSPWQVVRENGKRPAAYIIDFKVQNKNLWEFDVPIYEGSIREAKKIELLHDQNMFTIEFAVPWYADNNETHYTYILDGYEEHWHNNGANRLASYANVPPGKYKFRVRATYDNSEDRVLEIIVLPPWWATWWAMIIWTLIAVCIVYAVVRLVLYTMRQRREVYVQDRLAELKIRFFTNISHELRTPLTLIKGPIEELKNQESLSAKGVEYLNLIDNNAKKMLQLVNQILDFRKAQNGKMQLNLSLVDLTETLEMFRHEYGVLAQERDIAYNFELPAEHIVLRADAEKLGVVINNLINNAFKYTREGGRITISAQETDAGYCLIRVEDDGATIPNHQLEEIFERFAQATNEQSEDASHTGTGIGLSLSREYVKLHEGKIWAENISQGEGGVVFYVELPLMTQEDSASMQEENYVEEKLHDNIPTLLVVEDNLDLCKMLQMQLSEHYNVITAHDGEEGIKKVYQYHPDVIVSDLMMPKMDGMEMLKHIRNDFSISHIPVVILTAKSSDDSMMEAVRSGANAYVTKPFSILLLQARIEQLLDQQRVFQRKMMGASEDIEENYGQHLAQQDIDFVNQIHEIIEKNLNASDFNIDVIAEKVGLSRSAFFKKLKSLTGFAPVDFVREVRLTKAATLLKTTDDSVTNIAYIVGFRDSGYFTKCFRKKYKVTPKEYRSI